MGAKLSRNRGSSSSSATSQEKPSESDIGAYEDACREDPELQSFDSNLEQRTNRAVSSIAVGLDVRSVSLDSFREVTEYLLETNHEVLKIILRNKRDIWKNPELSDLVDDYFENSLLTLDFCTALESCLQRAVLIESIINVALEKFDEEHHSAPGPSGKSYSRTLEEFENFKKTGDPFTQEFFKVLNSIQSRQILLLEKLHVKKRKLDKKLSKLQAWKKVSNVIFIVAFASVLICSVVAAALAAPPVLTALAAAAAIPLGSMGKWLNSFWQKYEKDVMGQREIISSMQCGSYIVFKDLQNIRVLVDRFQIKIEGLLANADFAMNGDAEVVVAVEEIKRTVSDFFTTIHDLSKYANQCSQETRMTRTLILRRIVSLPNSSNQDNGIFS